MVGATWERALHPPSVVADGYDPSATEPSGTLVLGVVDDPQATIAKVPASVAM
jgi:hypothetical protein